jgi:glycosyltransferase involved in cell wall biosynthesis
MKIVFDARIHLNYYSGISRYIICLLEAYARLFPQDDLIVLLNPTIQKDNSIYRILEPFSQVQFKIIDAGHMGPKNYLVMGRKIKALKPDIYHYPHLDAPVFTGDIPIVATIHDVNAKGAVKKMDDRFGLKQVYINQAIKTTLKKAHAILFVSDSVREEVIGAFHAQQYADKCIRIYNGMEADFHQIESEKADALRKNMNVMGPFLFYVGQIREHKNIRRIIAAFEAFHQRHAKYQLVIVGHNYLNLDLSAEHIIQIDKVDNQTLKALYEGCSALLFPSLFEGFGFPILEAFSFGKPVVTTHYGATAEIGGDLATLVDPLNVNAIADGIEGALKSEHQSAKRRLHAEKFSWENHVNELREVYQRLYHES